MVQLKCLQTADKIVRPSFWIEAKYCLRYCHPSEAISIQKNVYSYLIGYRVHLIYLQTLVISQRLDPLSL